MLNKEFNSKVASVLGDLAKIGAIVREGRDGLAKIDEGLTKIDGGATKPLGALAEIEARLARLESIR
jgi:hypothetical protein